MSALDLLRRWSLLRRSAAVHLQWFAAEDEGRTEEPTEHKIRKAREEGKVAKSSEMVSALVLLFPVVLMAILGPSLVGTMADMMRFYFQKISEPDSVVGGTLFISFMRFFALLTLPVMAVACVAAVLGNLVQVGFLFTVKPITPDLTHIVPRFSKFVKRALLSNEAFFNLAKSIGKVVVIGLITWLNIQAEFPRLALLMHTNFLAAFGFVGSISVRILLEAALFMLGLSLVDYMFQKRLHIESLKMSRQEVVEERKMYEGDPLIKSRLKERMRRLLQRTMIQNVPRADVVVTNPTHFAVALEYKRETMSAPLVVAKGADHMAEAIKRAAFQHAVPVMENKPLARALYADVDIGDSVPEKYYQAVAAVLKEVYKLNETGSRRTGEAG